MSSTIPIILSCFANGLAILCQCDGTALPMRWQKIANVVAKPWQRRIGISDHHLKFIIHN